jgi:hypothetical protein
MALRFWLIFLFPPAQEGQWSWGSHFSPGAALSRAGASEGMGSGNRSLWSNPRRKGLTTKPLTNLIKFVFGTLTSLFWTLLPDKSLLPLCLSALPGSTPYRFPDCPSHP